MSLPLNPDRYKIDWHDTQKLWAFSMESCRISELYQRERKRYAGALKALKLTLAKHYGAGTIEKKIAEDKAYLILADRDIECREHLKNMIEAEGEYKGLEKVMDARSAALSFNQSLIKNESRQS